MSQLNSEENLSHDYDGLNYLDQYDELEDDKIIELNEGLNLEGNISYEDSNKDKKKKIIGLLFR